MKTSRCLATLLAVAFLASCASDHDAPAETSTSSVVGGPEESRFKDIADPDSAVGLTSVGGQPTIVVLPCDRSLKVLTARTMGHVAREADATGPVEWRYGPDMVFTAEQPTSTESGALLFELSAELVAEVQQGFLPQAGLENLLFEVRFEYADGSSGNATASDFSWPTFPEVRTVFPEQIDGTFETFAGACEQQ